MTRAMRWLRVAVLLALALAVATTLLARLEPVRTFQIDPARVTHERGVCYLTPLKSAARFGPFINTPDEASESASRIRLFENDRELGPAHSAHSDIGDEGGGRFSFWGRGSANFYFSASDGSDPRTNARRYRVETTLAFDPALATWIERVLLGVAALGALLLPILSLMGAEAAVRSRAGASLAAVAAGAAIAFISSGVLCVLGGAIALVGAVWFGVWTLLNAWLGVSAPRTRSLAANIALVSGAVGAAALLAEVALVALAGLAAASASKAYGDDFRAAVSRDFPIDRAAIDAAIARRDAKSMDPAWVLEPLNAADFPGSRRAEKWYGHLQVFGQDGERLPCESPLPADPSRPLILVVGDSLTWGQGVDTHDRFSEVMRREFESTTPVSVLNLGACGYQSEDVIGAVDRGLQRGHPVAVVYAACLNDFLPSGVGQYNTVWHMPESVKNRSRLASAVDAGLTGLQLRLGLANDFFDDIERGGLEWRERFGRDVKAMAGKIRAAGAVPIAIVVDQFPSKDGRGQKLAQAAEKYLSAGGFTVIPTEGYYERFSNFSMPVGAWEGHPNEIAHAIWGRMIAKQLCESLPELKCR